MTRALSCLRQALQDLALVDGDVAAQFTLVAVRVSTVPLVLEVAAHSQLAGIVAGGTGWCRFRSQVVGPGDTVPAFSVAGPPVTAEWTLSDSISCRLWPDPQIPGRGRVWTYEERTLGTSELADGETPFLCRKAQHLLRGDAGRVLSYHVFWGAGPGDDQSALRVLADRFAGFAARGTA